MGMESRREVSRQLSQVALPCGSKVWYHVEAVLGTGLAGRSVQREAEKTQLLPLVCRMGLACLLHTDGDWRHARACMSAVPSAKPGRAGLSFRRRGGTRCAGSAKSRLLRETSVLSNPYPSQLYTI